MENARVSHYELRQLLGRGGMGEVYEAFDLKAKRPVALKFVAPELAAEPEAHTANMARLKAAVGLAAEWGRGQPPALVVAPTDRDPAGPAHRGLP